MVKMNKVVLLAGGVGGAKLAVGLSHLLEPGQLTIIGNTGDDFVHCGLHISPDMDTLLYSLSEVVNEETGWGRRGESWRAMEGVAQLGGPSWFRLGDVDLATHLTRTQRLAEGWRLTEVSADFCQRLGVKHPILPMSDQLAPTQIKTTDGRILPFQTWFVQEQWQPDVAEVILPDVVQASSAVWQALESADLVIIAPSNPFVSIAPILNTYPIRPILEENVPQVIGVSPLIGGQAIKGPTAKLMQGWQLDLTASAVARWYNSVISAFVYDVRDSEAVDLPHLAVTSTDTLMQSLEDKKRLARHILNFAESLS